MAAEAKYQTRNLVDQTRSELRGQVNNQQSQLASKLNGLASELGSMASKSDESGPMTDLAQEASRRGGEIAHWLDTHEPATCSMKSSDSLVVGRSHSWLWQPRPASWLAE